MSYIDQISFKSLSIWSGNVRKINAKENLDELKSSIVSLGLLNPLTIFFDDETQSYQVVAGQRRYLAIFELIEENIIPADYEVNCLVIDKEETLEASLAENVIREDMQPADQFVAFKELAEQGFSISDIAVRFGATEIHVAKLLKLGRVSPSLIYLYRSEEIDMDQLQAFAITDDQDEQLKVWEAIKDLPSYSQNSRKILELLTKDEIAATDKRARFVTIEAYKAAGGIFRTDLFSENNEGYLSDPILLNKLLSEKIEAEKSKFIDAGWKWVEFVEEFGYSDRNKFIQEKGRKPAATEEEKNTYRALREEQKKLNDIDEPSDIEYDRLNEIDDLLEAMDNRPLIYSKEVIKRSGVIMYLSYQGNLEIEMGLTRKADAKKAASSKHDQETQDATQEPQGAISCVLLEYLHKERDAAIRAELYAKLDLCFRAFAYSIIRNYGGFLSVTVNVAHPDRNTPAFELYEEAEAEFAKWGMPEDPADLWDWIMGLEDYQVQEIISLQLAFSFRNTLSNTRPLLKEIGEFDMRHWFTPTADNYFSRIKADQIISDLKEMGWEGPQTAETKKKELVALAHNFVEQKLGTSLTWVPKAMRINYDPQEQIETEDDEDQYEDE